MELDPEYLAAINREQVRRYTEAREAYRASSDAQRPSDDVSVVKAALTVIVAERDARDRIARFRDEACQWLARIEGARAKQKNGDINTGRRGPVVSRSRRITYADLQKRVAESRRAEAP